MKLHNAYLLAYNVVQFCLWSQVLYKALATTITAVYKESAEPIPGLIYDASIHYIEVGQTLAWMEVVHAAVGLVGGGVATAFVQCLGRYVVLLYVIMPIRFIHEAWATVIMVAVWSAADVVRYLFYIQSLAGQSSRILLWLRYTLFIVLYPVGVAAEWMVYLFTLEYVEQTEMYAVKMPNAWNFAFNFGIWNRFVLVSYFYFGPFMFLHMWRQRKKKLHSNSGSRAA